MGRRRSWQRAFLVASTLSSSYGTTPTVAGFQPNARCRHLHTTAARISDKESEPWNRRQNSHRHSTRRFLSKKKDGKEETEQPEDDEEELIPLPLPKDPREAILARNPPEDQEVVKKTLDWLQNVVMGLNLCPFAEKPFKSKQLNVEVVRGRDEELIITIVLSECLLRSAEPGTSLIVCPDLYPRRFDLFLQTYNVLSEGVLEDNNLTDHVQLAPFHPLFEFDGSGSDGVDNYTNRSPYPIFHVLREDEVSKAVDLLDGDASKVWRRNVELLNALDETLDSRQQLEDVMSGKKTDNDTRQRIKTILADLKKRSSEI